MEKVRLTRSSKAFTLIELLVVIAIIALLLSVLMPALRKAREQARQAVCTSHLHSWGTSFALYGNDNDQKVNPSLVCFPDNVAPTAIVCWDDTLSRYYADKKIMICASAQKPGTDAFGLNMSRAGSKNTYWEVDTQHRNGLTYHAVGGYGVNIYASYPEVNVWEKAGQASLAWHWGLLTMKNAQEIPLMGDCAWRETYPSNKHVDGSGSACGFRTTENGARADWGIDNFNMRRHGKQVDMVFYDSSVRRLLLPELWTLRWSRDFDMDPTPPRVFPAWMTK